MGARKKLNEANIFGALIWGGFLGFVTGSWAVFIIASTVFIVAAIYSGDIRSRNYRRHKR